MGKYISRSVRHLLDSAEEVKEEIYEALERGRPEGSKGDLQKDSESDGKGEQ